MDYIYSLGLSKDLLSAVGVEAQARKLFKDKYNLIKPFASPQILYLLKYHLSQRDELILLIYISSTFTQRLVELSYANTKLILIPTNKYSRYLFFLDAALKLFLHNHNKHYKVEYAFYHWTIYWPLSLVFPARKAFFFKHDSLAQIRYTPLMYIPIALIYLGFLFFRSQSIIHIGSSAGLGLLRRLKIPVSFKVLYLPYHGSFLEPRVSEARTEIASILIIIDNSRIKGIEYFLPQLTHLSTLYNLHIVGLSPSYIKNYFLKAGQKKQSPDYKKINFHGTISHASVVQLMLKCHALIYYSKIDVVPGVVIEARACGVKVLSTSVGDLPYLYDVDPLCIIDNSFIHSLESLTRYLDQLSRARHSCFIPPKLMKTPAQFLSYFK